MILVDGAGHEIDMGPHLDGVQWIEIRAECRECGLTRCFFPKKEGP